MNRINQAAVLPLDPHLGRTAPVGSKGQATHGHTEARSTAFKEILQKQLDGSKGVRFSAHALGRLSSRSINFTNEDMGRLTDAVDRAAAKGARDALVLMPGASRSNDLALVVSVDNRTVITAMDGDHMQENVFTNIDSAVVAR